MSRRRACPPAPKRLRRAVLAVAFALLGFQIIGGSLHAAGLSHDSATECQFCLALDRAGPADGRLVDLTPLARSEPAPLDRPPALVATPAPDHYAARAPPPSRHD